MPVPVDVVYDPADISVLTVEDNHFNASFRVKELVIGEHTGVRPKLPEALTPVRPPTSRLLDEKQKHYDAREISAKRAIRYADLNQAAGPGGRTAFTTQSDKGGETNV